MQNIPMWGFLDVNIVLQYAHEVAICVICNIITTTGTSHIMHYKHLVVGVFGSHGKDIWWCYNSTAITGLGINQPWQTPVSRGISWYIRQRMGWEGSNEYLWWQALTSQEYIQTMCALYQWPTINLSKQCVCKKWQYQVFSYWVGK